MRALNRSITADDGTLTEFSSSLCVEQQGQVKLPLASIALQQQSTHANLPHSNSNGRSTNVLQSGQRPTVEPSSSDASSGILRMDGGAMFLRCAIASLGVVPLGRPLIFFCGRPPL